jgi:hypothetical protein
MLAYLMSIYRPKWLSSGDGNEIFTAWLDALRQQVSAKVKAIWEAGSESVHHWYRRACEPAVIKALDALVKEEQLKASPNRHEILLGHISEQLKKMGSAPPAATATPPAESAIPPLSRAVFTTPSGPPEVAQVGGSTESALNPKPTLGTGGQKHGPHTDYSTRNAVLQIRDDVRKTKKEDEDEFELICEQLDQKGKRKPKKWSARSWVDAYDDNPNKVKHHIRRLYRLAINHPQEPS